MSEDAYFRRTGPTTYAATERTAGAWSTTEQHVSPLCGLLVHALETDLPREDLQLGRFSVDVLGVVPVDEVDVGAVVLRAGRTIELVEVTATHAGRAVARARAWRLARADTSAVAALEQPVLPAREEMEAWPMTSVWPGGYIASLDVRRDAGARPGRCRAWVSTAVPLVADEQVSPVARVVALVDTANGLSVRVPPARWLFPNVDLTVHLHRQPVGPPVGFDTAVTFGADGLGLTSTVLHDEHGPVGTAAQVLTLRPVP